MRGIALKTGPQAISSRPSAMSRDLSDRLAWMTNQIETHPGAGEAIPDTALPTPSERQSLQDRKRSLEAMMAPGNRVEIGLTISELLSTFPSVRHDAEAAAQMVAAYTAHAEKFPLWAVREACAEIVARGSTWPPSAGEIIAAAQGRLTPYRREVLSIDRVLKAQVFHVETESEKARVSEGFDKLREDLALHDDRFHKPGEPHQKYRLTKVDYERMVEEMERNPVVLPPMSNALKKIVRQQKEGV